MKKVVIAFLLSVVYTSTYSQPKEFEGVIVYKVEVKSKMPGISDRTRRNVLALGDSMTTFIKQGNYRQHSGISDVYTISKMQKVFMRFTGIDTLFYLDYSFDTSKLLSVKRPDEQKLIKGFDCKALTVETTVGTYKYFYAPSLYLNPEREKNNTISRFDVFAKETSSVWLAQTGEFSSYNLSETCIGIEQKKIDDAVFELPPLPQKPFSFESVGTAPQFSGKDGWISYLQGKIDGKLGAKYIKIPRKEESAMQTAIVEFTISVQGRPVDIKVLNEDEVHPKLAEEAKRVIMESPRWNPATLFGEKFPFLMRQPITFQASRQ
ncbi:MAG: energy transducer TonB [Chitinophagaceae bacterium]